MTSLGIVVPCRDEAAVIARKLRNLALCRWPEARRPHRVVVVDDGSGDATAEIARAESGRFEASGVAVAVIANDVRPGKGGAIESGLRELGDAVDIAVLTDADVVLDPEALVALARAFESDRALAMASGAQRFVESLAHDGSVRDEAGGALTRRDTLYDRFGAVVRTLESRAGLVFSVQGQLMAWRRELGLVPTPRIAADDLDLMLQARLQGRAIRRVVGARFFEVRPADGRERQRQVVRRARAYCQFLKHPRIAELSTHGSSLARRQARVYLRAGRLRGAWSSIPLIVVFATGMAFGTTGAVVAAAACALALLPPWIVLLQVRARMQVAESLEARGPMGERWDTARR